MDKIKVEKDVYEALNFIMKDGNFVFYKNENNELKKELLLKEHSRFLNGGSKWRFEVKAIRKLGLYELALILEHGYELEKTPEEELVEFYLAKTDDSPFENGTNFGVKYTLDKLNIKIEGINA